MVRTSANIRGSRPSRAPVDSRFRVRHVLDRHTRVTNYSTLQTATQGECDLHIPITFLSALNASFLHITNLLLHSSRTLGQHPPFHHRYPDVAFTIQKLDYPTGSAHVYSTALLVFMKESIGFNPGAFSLTSFLLFLTQWGAFSALGDRSV
jgi:hypothetical protein